MTNSGGRDFDVLIVGDFRFPGGTSAAIAEEIRAQSEAGYRSGLIQRRSPILRQERPTHPNIQACIDQGMVDIVDTDRHLQVGLLILHHPFVFVDSTQSLPPIDAERKILVVHQPPFDAMGDPYYDAETVHRNVSELVGPGVEWAPISATVRRQFQDREIDVPLFEFDWFDIIHPSDWTTPRPPLGRGRLVVGRHSRPDWQKWPDTRELALCAWPADPDYDVRILGGGAYLYDAYAPLPANWKVFGFNDINVRSFLSQIHVFVYFHHSSWVEAFGRTIMEALASGATCILPPHFADLFGDAALYCDITEVPELLRKLRTNSSLRRVHEHRGPKHIAKHFGPAVHRERLEKVIGMPAPRRRQAIATDRSAQERVLMCSSNGIGIGHLTRLLAIASRLPKHLTPVFVTMSQAMPIIGRFGYLAEFIPFHAYLECESREWNEHLLDELDAMIDFYRPRALVFDGNTAYAGLIDARRRWPECRFVWSRRAMWSPHVSPGPIERQTEFDMVIEPRDIAEERDTGPTVPYRNLVQRVNPVMLLDTGQYLPRAEARRELGLQMDGTAVLLQLGSGNNLDILSLIDVALELVAGFDNVETRLAEWVISDEPLDPFPDVPKIRDYPIARFFNAFDFAISAVGYNSFHELVCAALPTIFVPNTNPMMDNQLARAEYVAEKGAGLMMLPDEAERLPDLLAQMLDSDRRSGIKRACRALALPNGAAAAAGFVARLAADQR